MILADVLQNPLANPRPLWQSLAAMEVVRRPNWFLWGMGLAAIPSVPLLIAFRAILVEVSNQKQTGLGAVAGGASEAFMMLGMLVSLALPLAAIFALFRSLSRSNMGRSVIASVAIGWSLLLLLYYGGTVWMLYHFQR
jgi:hypothetical protein